MQIRRDRERECDTQLRVMIIKNNKRKFPISFCRSLSLSFCLSGNWFAPLVIDFLVLFAKKQQKKILEKQSNWVRLRPNRRHPSLSRNNEQCCMDVDFNHNRFASYRKPLLPFCVGSAHATKNLTPPTFLWFCCSSYRCCCCWHRKKKHIKSRNSTWHCVC